MVYDALTQTLVEEFGRVSLWNPKREKKIIARLKGVSIKKALGLPFFQQAECTGCKRHLEYYKMNSDSQAGHH